MDAPSRPMMQSLPATNNTIKVRGCFRRPQQAPSMPFQQSDRKSSRTSPQTASSRSHRKAGSASREFRSSENRVYYSRDLAPVRYPVYGNNLVEAIRYTEPSQATERGRIWINQTQYFDSVSPSVWNFVLGGRQICQKWLQERQGCVLCEKSIQHYQQMLTILKDMVDLMSGIDTVMQEKQSHKHNLTDQHDPVLAAPTVSYYMQPELVMSSS